MERGQGANERGERGQTGQTHEGQTKGGTKEGQTKGGTTTGQGERGTKEGQTKGGTTTGQGERGTKEGQTKGGTTQQTGQGERGTRTGETGTGTSTGSASLNTEQRTKIRETVLRGGNVNRVSSVNFNVSVGTVVPHSVRLVAVPASIVEIHPAWRGYEYFVVNDEIIIVEPGTLKIVAVIS